MYIIKIYISKLYLKIIKMPKMSRKYCLSTSPKRMGFSQKASCKAQGFLKRTSKKYKNKYVVSSKYKSKNKSLYSSGKNKPKTKTGYSSSKIAKQTLKNISKRPKTYQIQVVNTMYNRAKYHKSQTNGMKDAMKVYKSWLLQQKLTKKTKNKTKK